MEALPAMSIPTPSRRATPWITGLVVLMPLLGGCRGALVGDWHLVEAIPNREVFSLDNATFRRDGTFSAVTTIEGMTTAEQGQYDFNGFKLKLRPRAGGQRAYLASVRMGRLELADGSRKVVLQKGKRGP
jgi:hypothetical protein